MADKNLILTNKFGKPVKYKGKFQGTGTIFNPTLDATVDDLENRVIDLESKNLDSRLTTAESDISNIKDDITELKSISYLKPIDTSIILNGSLSQTGNEYNGTSNMIVELQRLTKVIQCKLELFDNFSNKVLASVILALDSKQIINVDFGYLSIGLSFNAISSQIQMSGLFLRNTTTNSYFNLLELTGSKYKYQIKLSEFVAVIN